MREPEDGARDGWSAGWPGEGGKGEDRNGREHRDDGENKRNRNRPGRKKNTRGEKKKTGRLSGWGA